MTQLRTASDSFVYDAIQIEEREARDGQRGGDGGSGGTGRSRNGRQNLDAAEELETPWTEENNILLSSPLSDVDGSFPHDGIVAPPSSRCLPSTTHDQIPGVRATVVAAAAHFPTEAATPVDRPANGLTATATAADESSTNGGPNGQEASASIETLASPRDLPCHPAGIDEALPELEADRTFQNLTFAADRVDETHPFRNLAGRDFAARDYAARNSALRDVEARCFANDEEGVSSFVEASVKVCCVVCPLSHAKDVLSSMHSTHSAPAVLLVPLSPDGESAWHVLWTFDLSSPFINQKIGDADQLPLRPFKNAFGTIEATFKWQATDNAYVPCICTRLLVDPSTFHPFTKSELTAPTNQRTKNQRSIGHRKPASARTATELASSPIQQIRRTGLSTSWPPRGAYGGAQEPLITNPHRGMIERFGPEARDQPSVSASTSRIRGKSASKQGTKAAHPVQSGDGDISAQQIKKAFASALQRGLKGLQKATLTVDVVSRRFNAFLMRTVSETRPKVLPGFDRRPPRRERPALQDRATRAAKLVAHETGTHESKGNTRPATVPAGEGGTAWPQKACPQAAGFKCSFPTQMHCENCESVIRLAGVQVSMEPA